MSLAEPSIPRRQITFVGESADAVALVLIALMLRAATFGDPVYHVGDEFYRLVGIAMHDGALPYVDIWDRKPPGLFILYYLFAAFSEHPATYQIAAWLSAAAAAWFIRCIAIRWTSRRGALLGGVIYLVILGLFWGGGGEAAVFYNTLLAGAGWLLLDPSPRRAAGAMLCAGIAVTLKQTAAFEGAFFGLVILCSRLPARVVAACALVAAMPLGLCALWYFEAGYGAEFWQAMAGSSITRAPPSAETMLARGLDSLLRLTPLLLMAVWGARHLGNYRRLMVGWLLAAGAGYLAVPEFYPHYVLPLLVPLCLMATGLLGRGWIGAAAAGLLTAHALTLQNPFDSSRVSIAETRAMARIISEDRAGRLLVFDGPTYLYSLPHQQYLSPLVFPTHLNQQSEADVSQFGTATEMAHILDRRPTTIVIAQPLRNQPVNALSLSALNGYIAANCRLRAVLPLREMRSPHQFRIWRCQRPISAASSPAAR